MKFSEILNRLTGISCPIFGVSWNPTETQRTIARRIIIFLEAKRVLYADFGDEAVCHCVDSALEIKNFLTNELPNIDEASELYSYVRAMRTATNKFLGRFPKGKQKRCVMCRGGSIENWIFISAVGELRGVFGIMVGQISKAYGIDVEDELAQIIPE